MDAGVDAGEDDGRGVAGLDLGGLVGGDDAQRGVDAAGDAGGRGTAADAHVDGPEGDAVDAPLVAGGERGDDAALGAAPAVAGVPQQAGGVGLVAGGELDLRVHLQGAQAREHGGRQAGGLDRHRGGGQLDGLDDELEALGEGDALADDEADLGDAAAVDREAAAQGEQPEIAATQAEEGVALGDPRVVDLQGGAPQATDEVAGDERSTGPVRQSEGRVRTMHGSL